MNKIFMIALIAVTSFSGCGGGGGGSSKTSSTFQSVATEGELIAYTVDTTALTYSYQITESAYGKTGATGSGSLSRNSDGSYTPSGINGKIVIQDSGLLLGAIYEDLDGNGTRDVIPVLGMSNPISSLADAADTYNFVSRQCSTTCSNFYGTMKLNSDGTWTSCVAGNLSAVGYSCTSSVSGDTGTFTSGRATIRVGGVTGGSLLIFKDPTTNQKAIILDFNGATSLGKGGLFAGSQTLPASANGNWAYTNTLGARGVLTVTGTDFTDIGINRSGSAYSLTGSFTRDQPWNGFVTTDSGSIVLTASSGIFASYYGPAGISIGIKK